MFNNQEIIAIIFKLINFTALIGLGVIFFKKYIKPDLLTSIIKKKEYLESLSAQQVSLEQQQLNLDAFLKDDAMLCTEFRSKIDKWKMAVSLEADSLKIEQKKALVAYHKRTELITCHQQQQHLQKIVAHAVIKDLKTSLSNDFKDTEQKSDYLNAIINFMDKRTQ